MRITSWMRNLILPTREINNVLRPDGLVYEVGSGYGSLSFDLSKNYPKRQLIGIDTDLKKITKAKMLYAIPNLEFIHADANKFNFQVCKGIVMSDFLHHIDYKSQEKLLKQLVKKLRRGGAMIVKEITRDDNWRMWASRLWDLLLYPKDRIYYRDRAEWRLLLTSFGLQVEVKREVPWFPGSTFLFICKK